MESSPTASRAPSNTKVVDHVSGASGSDCHGACDDAHMHVNETLALATWKAA